MPDMQAVGNLGDISSFLIFIPLWYLLHDINHRNRKLFGEIADVPFLDEKWNK